MGMGAGKKDDSREMRQEEMLGAWNRDAKG